jgi:Flp pilus assembly pilin Flp
MPAYQLLRGAKNWRSRIKSFPANDSCSAAIEYAIIAAVLALAMIISLSPVTFGLTAALDELTFASAGFTEKPSP